MTKEQATEVLHELDGSLYETQQVALDMAIKALEQQPCEDAISRQAVLDLAVDYGTNSATFLIPVCSVKNLPPVTPTHGTCEDCKYNVKDKRTTTMCDIGHRFFMREPSTFYCADFERRGSENE